MLEIERLLSCPQYCVMAFLSPKLRANFTHMDRSCHCHFYCLSGRLQECPRIIIRERSHGEKKKKKKGFKGRSVFELQKPSCCISFPLIVGLRT